MNFEVQSIWNCNPLIHGFWYCTSLGRWSHSNVELSKDINYLKMQFSSVPVCYWIDRWDKSRWVLRGSRTTRKCIHYPDLNCPAWSLRVRCSSRRKLAHMISCEAPCPDMKYQQHSYEYTGSMSISVVFRLRNISCVMCQPGRLHVLPQSVTWKLEFKGVVA